MNAPILHCMQKLAYAYAAGVNPLAGIGLLQTQGAQPHDAVFLCLSFLRAVYGEPGESFRKEGWLLVSSRPTLVSARLPVIGLAWRRVNNLLSQGTITMHLPLLRLKNALNPSKKHRAAAHRKMALAALRSDSSLQNRLNRYNAHIAKARQLEGKGGAA